ncbi:MAG: alpha/beta hydrolase [Kiritimatiellae bacterium]|nr:alpha/beta hydrolase [Kiritimatiellia bacterium]
MKKLIPLFVAALSVGLACAGGDADKIAKDCKVFKQSKMQGFDWVQFEFEGCEAWLVEPAVPAKDGRWVWCMEWPTAFQDRTGVKALLAAGYRWVTFNPAYAPFIKVTEGNQTDEMVEKRHRFQQYLVKTLGLNAKCGLIGMSWGGFYSVRYASIHPEAVKAAYLDAPLLDISTLGSYPRSYKNYQKYYPFLTPEYVGADDPFQSVNRAAPIAAAKIPLLVLYGGKDTVVPPAKNIERFAPVFEKNGGDLTLVKRGTFGHHPHGVDPCETAFIVNFFEKAFNPPPPPKAKK